MEDSILTSVKKLVGVSAESTSFDLDVLTAVNSALAGLHQLGVIDQMIVEDDGPKWSDLQLGDASVSLARTYVTIKTMMFFDPPQTSYLIEARNQQLGEIEYRLVVQKEFIDG